jgi:hypothetical protein
MLLYLMCQRWLSAHMVLLQAFQVQVLLLLQAYS